MRDSPNGMASPLQGEIMSVRFRYPAQNCGVEQKLARRAHNPEVVVEHFPPPQGHSFIIPPRGCDWLTLK